MHSPVPPWPRASVATGVRPPCATVTAERQTQARRMGGHGPQPVGDFPASAGEHHPE
jgi:hypothetical protein